MERDEVKRERENKAAGRECPNSVYCKECVVHPETDTQIKERRESKGYR